MENTSSNKSNQKYHVVINSEHQYSIWFSGRPLPKGWNDVGKTGTKEECLDYIKSIWLDIRPLSLKEKMNHAEQLRVQ